MNEEQGFETLSELASGFQKSRIFLSALELDIFTRIGDQGRTAAEIAAKLRTNLRATEILLNALAGIGLLSKSGQMFLNTPLTLRFLVAGQPDYVGVGLRHSANMWARWHHLTGVVKTGRIPARPARGPEAQASLESFIMLMHERAKYRAPKVADALDLSGVRSVLDVGGGPGTHSIEFAKRNPDLKAVIFDLPDVILIARRIIHENGMEDRVTLQPGDYYVDDFVSGCDLVFLSAIIHSNGPEGNKKIFRKAFDALNPGGKIALVDFIMDDERVRPEFGAVFAVNMLVGTEEGNSYSAKEIGDWLAQAGFADISLQREIDEDISLMTAVRPG